MEKRLPRGQPVGSLWVFFFLEEMFLVSSLSENPAGQDLRLRECAPGAPSACLHYSLGCVFEKSCVNGFLQTIPFKMHSRG